MEQSPGSESFPPVDVVFDEMWQEWFRLRDLQQKHQELLHKHGFLQAVLAHEDSSAGRQLIPDNSLYWACVRLETKNTGELKSAGIFVQATLCENNSLARQLYFRVCRFTKGGGYVRVKPFTKKAAELVMGMVDEVDSANIAGIHPSLVDLIEAEDDEPPAAA